VLIHAPQGATQLPEVLPSSFARCKHAGVRSSTVPDG
jgi:hypothetical protein